MIFRAPKLTRSYLPAGLVLASLAAALVGAPPTRAQNNEVRSLIEQVTRLRSDLDALQRHVYAGAPLPTAPGAAATAAPEPTQPQAARLQLRINELEGELRNLTGQIEEVAFKLDRVGRRLDKLVEDVDFRLSALEQPGRGTAAAGEAPAVAATPAAEATGTSPAPGEAEVNVSAISPEQTAAPPGQTGTLGTVTASDLASVRQGAGTAPAPPSGEAAPAGTVAAPAAAVASTAPSDADVLPAGSPGDQYEYAKTLLGQGEWELAQQAFQAFLERNPGDRYAANAHYWLGETYYVRKDYKAAAEAFLVGYRNFPKSPKAPDSLLKLGMSLAQLGETKEACTTLAAVKEQFETSAESVVRVADRERKKLGCG